MPATKHRRRGKGRPRRAPPPRPPRWQLTDEERREDALLEEHLHQLFGPPATVLDADTARLVRAAVSSRSPRQLRIVWHMLTARAELARAVR